MLGSGGLRATEALAVHELSAARRLAVRVAARH